MAVPSFTPNPRPYAAGCGFSVAAGAILINWWAIKGLNVVDFF